MADQCRENRSDGCGMNIVRPSDRVPGCGCGCSKRPTPQKIDFDKLSFEEKKLVASEFISRILISANDVANCRKV